MNNLDSMVLSKLPFNVHQPGRGYSHNTQFYNFFNKNLKFVLSSKVKRRTLLFIKKKGLVRPMFNIRKIGRRVMTRPTSQTRTTSLTFITLAQSHYLTHTMLMPWPNVWGGEARRRLKITTKVRRLKLSRALVRLNDYENAILDDLVSSICN